MGKLFKGQNWCDYNHQTTGEIRALPTGGDSNALVCRKCYEKMLRERLQNVFDGIAEKDFPTWKILKVYSNAIR